MGFKNKVCEKKQKILAKTAIIKEWIVWHI